MFFYGHTTRAEEASSQPMIENFGEDGYIWLGAGMFVFAIQNENLIHARSGYLRNIDRAISLIKSAANASKKDRGIFLGPAFIAIMTAYEVLIDELLESLSTKFSEIKQKNPNTRRTKIELLLNLLIFPYSELKELLVHTKALEYLSAFRNCIAHNGGVIDKIFLRRMSDIPDIRNLPLGIPAPLELSVATSFADSCQRAAFALLKKTQDMFENKISYRI